MEHDTYPSKPILTDTTLDKRLAKKWCTKKEALQAATIIPGYVKSDVRKIEIMGFRMWGICDDHMVWLSESGYIRWTGLKK